MGIPNSAAFSSETIFALSSGPAPAAIAIVRISGPGAKAVLASLTGGVHPIPRRASVRTLRNPTGDILDQALILWLPGPRTATGEDLAELHLHGGRAVVAAVLACLASIGLRAAEPGEFTRRALMNGRLDLSEVEGLADLLAAETEAQRREAITRSSGMLRRQLDRWADWLVGIAARIEAAIDYDGEVEEDETRPDVLALIAEIDTTLTAPPVERLRDGLRLVIAGPPNAGKSSLFNAILGIDAAIVSPIAGTTRDALERPIAIDGLPFVLIDTAGDREALDPIERIGVTRAREARAAADIILDLAADGDTGSTLAIAAKADLGRTWSDAHPVSAKTGEGLDQMLRRIAELGRTMLPRDGEMALDRRYRDGLWAIRQELRSAAAALDTLIIAEHVRLARDGLDRLTGRAGIDDMLDALFGRFCLGK